MSEGKKSEGKKEDYFYDFSNTEPSDELPPAIEDLSDRIAKKRARILRRRENYRKSKRLLSRVTKDKTK